VGKQYTDKEICLIQDYAVKGLTDREIADKLNRTPDAIRNIRHRHNLEQNTKKTLATLKQETKTIQKRKSTLEQQIARLQTRRDQVTKALQVDEQTLEQRIHNSLTRLKHQQPELFYITGQEQLGKLTAQLATYLIRWLIE
jgi:septal ring factor EnvC (AmiA/AmiB activator)